MAAHAPTLASANSLQRRFLVNLLAAETVGVCVLDTAAGSAGQSCERGTEAVDEAATRCK